MRTEQKDTESDLVAKAKLGCCSAFTCLLEKAFLKLNQYLYSTNLNHTDIQDISQEAIIKAWLNLHRFSGRSSFCTWVKRIADQIIKRANRTEKPYLVELTDDIIDQKPSPLEQIIRQEQLQLLQSFVQSLPRTERIVFILHILEALPYKDVCAKTGQRNWAARKACQRAIAKFEKYLTNEQKELYQNTEKKKKHRKTNLRQPVRQIYRRLLPWTNSNGKRLYCKVPGNEETENKTYKTSCYN